MRNIDHVMLTCNKAPPHEYNVSLEATSSSLRLIDSKSLVESRRKMSGCVSESHFTDQGVAFHSLTASCFEISLILSKVTKERKAKDKRTVLARKS